MRHIALNYIYLSRHHAGGKDQVGLNLLKGFQENGVASNMYIICYDYSVDVIQSISKDVKIIPIPSWNTKSELSRILQLIYVNTFLIPKIIIDNAIDCIFHLSCCTGLKKLKARSIVIPHDIKAISHRDLPGLHIPFYKYYIYKIMYNLDFKHADTIIAISDVDKKEMAQFFPKCSSKVIRIYNPIDIPVPERFIPISERRNVVAVNLQFHHKNVITLIKAFEKIIHETDQNLILIGNIPPRVQYLREYVSSHNLDERIIFTGFVTDEERNKLLNQARLYVTSTLFEGFGMVSIEAMVLGTPSLLSDIPVNREITKNMCNYYSPPEDHEALADQLKKELQRQYDISTLSHISKEISDVYSYTKIAKLYYTIMQQ